MGKIMITIDRFSDKALIPMFIICGGVIPIALAIHGVYTNHGSLSLDGLIQIISGWLPFH